MRIATITIGILDAAVALIVAVYIFKFVADPIFLGLDTFVGWAVIVLGLVTAVPALVLAMRSQRSKSALVLALAFPLGFAGILVGVFVYFTYFM